MVLDCKLNRYLADINRQAEKMLDTLISQYRLFSMGRYLDITDVDIAVELFSNAKETVIL